MEPEIETNETKNGKWTHEEDVLLEKLVKEHGQKNWKRISSIIGTRTAVQCLHRWTKILTPGLIKGPWTIEEDRKLGDWVKQNGPGRWSHCAEIIKGRSGKQCRERWFNTLNPVVKKGNWAPDEDYKIFKLYSLYGSKWSKIASHFEGRTENSIKNRFYSTLRRLHSEKCRAENKTNVNSLHVSLDELVNYFPIALEKKRKLLDDPTIKRIDQEVTEEKMDTFISRKHQRDIKDYSNGSRSENGESSENLSNVRQINFNHAETIVSPAISVESMPENLLQSKSCLSLISHLSQIQNLLVQSKFQIDNFNNMKNSYLEMMNNLQIRSNPYNGHFKY